MLVQKDYLSESAILVPYTDTQRMNIKSDFIWIL